LYYFLIIGDFLILCIGAEMNLKVICAITFVDQDIAVVALGYFLKERCPPLLEIVVANQFDGFSKNFRSVWISSELKTQ